MCCASGKAVSRQIKPVKRAGGRRYYRPDDVDLLKGIRALLYNDGFTIKGVQKVLKDRGLRHVAEIGRGGTPGAPAPVVIEKLVYVEKPVAAPVRKARPTHLRAVPGTMSLPFFDEARRRANFRCWTRRRLSRNRGSKSRAGRKWAGG